MTTPLKKQNIYEVNEEYLDIPGEEEKDKSSGKKMLHKQSFLENSAIKPSLLQESYCEREEEKDDHVNFPTFVVDEGILFHLEEEEEDCL